MRSPLASPFRGGWRNVTPMRARGRGGVPWSPANLAPYAWYDANIGGSSTQITDSSGNGRAAATFGATTAAPTWLPYTTPAVYLTGVASSYISTPDSAALSFSNDIEVVCRIKPVDYTTAANQTIIGKYNTTSNQRSWRFYISTTGAIVLTASADGTAVTSCSITPSSAPTDNTWIWARMRLDLTNGSNSVGTFETAADTGSNDDVPTVWTSNGSATSTTISGIFDSTAALEIGSFGNGTSERFNGSVGRMIVRSGFDGTTVADFNATLTAQTGYTASSPAVTWTVNRPTTGLKTVVQSAPAGSARSIVLMGSKTIAVPAAAVPAMSNSDAWTLLVVARLFAQNVTNARLLDDKASATNTDVGISLRYSSANILTVLGDGTNQAFTAGVTPANGVVNLVASVASTSQFYTRVNDSSSSLVSRPASSQDSSASLMMGAVGVSVTALDLELLAILTFNRELQSSEIAQLGSYYGYGT